VALVRVPNARIVSRSNSMLGTVSAVKASLGVAPLPTTLGDAEETLVQILPTRDRANPELVCADTPGPAQDAPRRCLRDHVMDDVPALRSALIG
jgi:DNA-binding transcriptional LysR family regulator